MNFKIASRYIDIARDISKNIDRSNKHVSLIFHKSQVIAIGTNECKTHPLAIKHGYHYHDMHSELAAFVKCKHLINNKLCLVNYHFNRFGQLKMSKPCAKCTPWVTQIFNDIWYSTGDGFVQLIY